MKLRRGMAFSLLSALSLLVALAAIWFWNDSFQSESHLLSFLSGGQRYTLKSKWGQFVFWGPPQPQAADEEAGGIWPHASNADLEWTSFSAVIVEGKVGEKSATMDLFQKLRRLQRDKGQREMAVRTWLAGMDDPDRFMVAHMMLLFCAEDKWRRYFYMSPQWRDAGTLSLPAYSSEELREPVTMWEQPYLRMYASAGGGTDSTRREKLRQQWHDVLDERRWTVFDGWAVLAALILPLAWASRPRWRHKSLRRWSSNWLALVLGLICTASSIMWARSYWLDEQFTFVAQPSDSSAKFVSAMAVQHWVASSRGKLLLFENDAHERLGILLTPGFQKTKSGGLSALWPGPTIGNAQRQLKLPGVEYRELPTQVLTITTPARTIVAGSGKSRMTYPIPGYRTSLPQGYRALALSWWLIALTSGLWPAMWAWRAGAQWRRTSRAKKTAAKICLHCGYDMRVTPERCPECGNYSAVLSG